MEILLKHINENMNKKINEIKEEFAIQTNNLTTNIVITIEEKLKPLIDENKKLKKEIEVLHNKVHSMEKEVRKNNVILHGIEETEKNNLELLQVVLTTLNEVAKDGGLENFDKWEISEVRRLGKKEDKKRRPILLKLTLAWRRTEILKNNKKFPKNIYATEDIPKDILIIRKELKIKQQEEIKKGNLAIIRYDKLIIKENPKQSNRESSLKDKQLERDNTETKRKRSPTKSPPRSGTKRYETGPVAPSKINKSYDIFRHRANSTSNL